MAKAGDIRYCDLLGGRKTNAMFVYVPASAFWMGDNRAQPLPGSSDRSCHLVGLSNGFWIQKTALTNDQWEYAISGRMPDVGKQSSNPKVNLSRVDAALLCKSKLGLRLPTEAEWELAARGGIGQRYDHAGSNIPKNVEALSQKPFISGADAWVPGVGKLRPNTLGICDMTGYIYEWCQDTAQWDDDENNYNIYYGLGNKSAPKYNPLSKFSDPDSTVFVQKGLAYEQNIYKKTNHVYRRAYSACDSKAGNYGVRLVWGV